MMRYLAAASLVFALLTPFAGAHNPPTLQPGVCNPYEYSHHYHGATSLNANAGIGTFSWVSTVVLQDGCISPPGPFDGEGEFGWGGGFLDASHHDAANQVVCLFDETWGNTVPFKIGVDLDGDRNIDRMTDTLWGCGVAWDLFGPMPPGADGGWWVFILNEVHPTFGWMVTPTMGHICNPGPAPC